MHAAVENLAKRETGVRFAEAGAERHINEAEELKIVVVQGEESNEKRCISNDGKKSCADSNYVQEIPKEKCGQIDSVNI